MLDILKKETGFSLVELMIATAIMVVVVAGVMAAFHNQIQTNVIQNESVDAAQDARAVLYLLERELRLAGADPSERADTAGITLATSTQLDFSMDIAGGDTDGRDNDLDGLIDEADEASYGDGDTLDANEFIQYGPNGLGEFGRQVGGAGGYQTIAQNIEAVDFLYRDAADALLPLPVPGPQLANIRSIEITLVIATDAPGLLTEKTAPDNRQFLNSTGAVIFTAPGDQRRRVSATARVYCRNMRF